MELLIHPRAITVCNPSRFALGTTARESTISVTPASSGGMIHAGHFTRKIRLFLMFYFNPEDHSITNDRGLCNDDMGYQGTSLPEFPTVPRTGKPKFRSQYREPPYCSPKRLEAAGSDPAKNRKHSPTALPKIHDSLLRYYLL